MPDKTGFKFPLQKSDGSWAQSSTENWIYSWGANGYGELGDSTVTSQSSPIQIGLLGTWKQLSSGLFSRFNQAIKTDGTLWAWGYNVQGALGNGTTIRYSSPIQVGALTNWSQVACGYDSSMAVKTDGTLWTWGYNNFGQLGNGTVNIYYSSPIQVGALTNWSQVACGYANSFAIKTNGSLWAWGNNGLGGLGIGVSGHYSSPIQIGTDTNWKQVSAGFNFGLAVKTNGTLWAWGNNGSQGLLGIGLSGGFYSSPVQVGLLTNWSQVACGYRFVLSVKTDGSLWAWGDNASDQGVLGNNTTVSYSSPIQIGSLTTWKQASAAKHASAVKTDGTLWSWGNNTNGKLGNNTTTPYSSPIQIGSLTNWSQVNCGYAFSTAFSTRVTPNNYDMVDVFFAKDLMLDGNLMTVGRNDYYAVGNGTTIHYSSPVQVGSLTNWKKVMMRMWSGYGIKYDGTMWSWGWNPSGMLGDGTTTDRSSPVQIGTGTDWIDIKGSRSTMAATKVDGSVWVWGTGGNGQLGNNTTTSISSPQQLGATTDWRTFGTGGQANHRVAIKTDGTLWTWGYNSNGQLGNGTVTQYSSPVQIGTSTDWKMVYMGGTSSYAIKSNNTLWAWGAGGSGQLGNGATADYYSPIQVGTLSDWKMISADSNSVVGIRANGTLWTWGGNGTGQIGNGTAIAYSSPIQVGALTTWKIVDTDSGSVAAIKTDGTLWVWGYGAYGCLGNGVTVNYSSPVQVGSNTNWKQVSPGEQASVFLLSPDLP